jgi:hypothetical protein
LVGRGRGAPEEVGREGAGGLHRLPEWGIQSRGTKPCRRGAHRVYAFGRGAMQDPSARAVFHRRANPTAQLSTQKSRQRPDTGFVSGSSPPASTLPRSAGPYSPR